MIVSCPECSARYRLADDAIPPEGRTMRCAACQHRWHEMGPTVAPPPPDPAIAEPTPNQLARTPAEPPAPSTDRDTTRKTVAAIALSLALTAGAIAVQAPRLPPRDLDRVPWFAQLIDPPAAPRSPLGIVFEVAPQPVGDGRTLFVVTGEVINPTRVPQPVPPLEGRLVDAGGSIVHRWRIDAGAPSLPPGGRAAFDASAIGDGSERAVVRIAG